MNAKIFSIATVAGVLLGSAALAQAEERMSGPSATPGHQMQQKGSLPGHPGASGYAPGHRTTGLGDRGDRKHLKFGDRDDRRHIRGDRDDKMTGFGGRDRDDRKFDRDDTKKLDNDKR
jgi:hypothetical protein